MWLSKESLEEFKAICHDEFGVGLSDVEAHQRALEVLDLFSLLFVEDQMGASDRSADFDSTEA